MGNTKGADRLQADALPRVKRAYERACLDVVDDVKFQGRKLRPGPFLNALALWFAELPPAERTEFAARAVARLESWIATGGAPAAPELPTTEPAGPAEPVSSPLPAARQIRRRK